MKKLIIIAFVLLLAVPTANATEILFGFVGSGYYNDGNNLADMIDVLPDYNVTRRNLWTTTYDDYSEFDQVWVYDLTTGTNVNVHQTANYANIANWYNNLLTPNIIVDGRIVSSADSWTDRAKKPDETSLIQNYATVLDAEGGGLILGTDHATAFTRGINEINRQIGIGDFSGFYYTPPLEAVIDVESPLYSAGVGFPCSDGSGRICINDNSSTSFAPTGMQANGQFLTPLAYHGNLSQAFDNAAVASNLESPTFLTPEPGTFILTAFGLLGMIGLRRKFNK
ncbi:MAG: PEP-CTERM sorting domain-containing protein [Desulfobacteraceae bacterium]|nr:PEP-CTERM sorting domain-containing protein [Desulfobacteraceae bacterium]